jgi:predicted component of type VI protein secretion system
MPIRLMAIDEGPNIPLDRDMVVVGRHPQCEVRLDSIRVSRRHCCMTQDRGEVVIRDLGSTNGIRINGQRVEKGRLRPGDELSIAHIRFRVEEAGAADDRTMADERSIIKPHVVHSNGHSSHENGHHLPVEPVEAAVPPAEPVVEVENGPDRGLAAALREYLPADVADQYRVQRVVPHPQLKPEAPVGTPEVCHPDSSQ